MISFLISLIYLNIKVYLQTIDMSAWNYIKRNSKSSYCLQPHEDNDDAVVSTVVTDWVNFWEFNSDISKMGFFLHITSQKCWRSLKFHKIKNKSV